MKEFDTRYDALRDSFLLEISNIVTGSVLTQISNIFGMKVHGSVPTGPEMDPVRTLKQILKEFPSFQPIIFTVKTNFMNTGRNLQLPLVIILDTDTMLKLLMIIRSKDVFAKNILAS
jgi:chemotaxis protein CheC